MQLQSLFERIVHMQPKTNRVSAARTQQARCEQSVYASMCACVHIDYVQKLPVHALITAQHNERVHHQVVLSVLLLPEQLSRRL